MRSQKPWRGRSTSCSSTRRCPRQTRRRAAARCWLRTGGSSKRMASCGVRQTLGCGPCWCSTGAAQCVTAGLLNPSSAAPATCPSTCSERADGRLRVGGAGRCGACAQRLHCRVHRCAELELGGWLSYSWRVARLGGAPSYVPLAPCLAACRPTTHRPPPRPCDRSEPARCQEHGAVAAAARRGTDHG